MVDPEQLQNTFCGTPAYLPPEIILCQPHQACCLDLWSMAVVLHVMIAGDVPFRSADEIIAAVYALPPSISTSCAALLSRALAKDPAFRPTIEQLCSHAWVQGEVRAADRKCIPSSEVVEISCDESEVVESARKLRKVADCGTLLHA